MLTPSTASPAAAADERGDGAASRVGAVLVVAAAVLAAGVLLLDVLPAWLTGPWHPSLTAAPLAATALGVGVREIDRRAHRSRVVTLRASLLACGFLAWSASQLAPSGGPATASNDAAILLFVADVALGVLSPRPE